MQKSLTPAQLEAIEDNIQAALREDIGTGDVSAALVDENTQAKAQLIAREKAVVCGRPWADALLAQFNQVQNIQWLYEEGDEVTPNQPILTCSGSARQLLTLERSLLNFLQVAMGTATQCRRLANQVSHTSVKLLDTRKTLPGLRYLQKYAVQVGGCYNHRLGLFDAVLIKENHIQSCGSIDMAVRQAKQIAPSLMVEVEVENMNELDQAIAAQVHRIMLDNFDLQGVAEAVARVKQKQVKAALEASGGIQADNLVAYAETGVDYISLGLLTKDLHAIDLSMGLMTL